MKKYLQYFLIGIIISCSNHLSQEERLIKDNIGKKVNLEMFEDKLVFHKDTMIHFNVLWSKYDFISLVYLQDGCSPCFPKIVDWHINLDSIGYQSKHTVLFIIEGSVYSNYEKITQNVLEVDDIEFNLFMTIDRGFNFLKGNTDIPFEIIASSVLVNKKREIVLIGNPFSSNEMKGLFKSILNL